MPAPLFADRCTAADVKDRLRRLYPATQRMGGTLFPGVWITVEEWNEIDLLAIGVTHATKRAWIAHEVKVSRSDLRTELLHPYKREAYKTFATQLYLAVPDGLLKPEELAYEEPEFTFGFDCPASCAHRRSTKTKTKIRVPAPVVRGTICDGRHASYDDDWEYVTCPTCKGSGSPAFTEFVANAPTLWVPRDVGLILVSGRKAWVEKEAPRIEPKALDRESVGYLARWISARPDPRHAGIVERARETQRENRAAERA